MKNEKFNIEELFHNGFEGHTINPSAKILRRLRFKLWLSDFFSFGLKKFNFVYSLVIITGLSLFLFPMINKTNDTESKFTANQSENNLSIVNNSVITNNNIEITIEEPIPPVENKVPAVSYIPSITQGCAPLEVTFKNTSINAEKYLWDFNNGKTSNEKNPSTIFSKPGQYTVSLLAENSDGATSKLKQTIIVYSKPEAAAEINIEESELKTKKIVFENKSTNADSYYWNFGDNSTSNKYDVAHTYGNFGKYHVVLIAYSQYGCSDTTVISNNFIEKNFELSFPPKFRPGTYNSQNSGFYENATDQNFIFYPLNNGAQNYELRIFAPNGVEVFKTTNVKQGWNGFIKGRVASPGRYTFTAKGVYPNGKKFEIKSTVDVLVDEVNGYY